MYIFPILCILVILPGCASINEKIGLDDDHVIEEVAEELIRQKTDVDIDLTPKTPENNQGKK